MIKHCIWLWNIYEWTWTVVGLLPDLFVTTRSLCAVSRVLAWTFVWNSPAKHTATVASRPCVDELERRGSTQCHLPPRGLPLWGKSTILFCSSIEIKLIILCFQWFVSPIILNEVYRSGKSYVTILWKIPSHQVVVRVFIVVIQSCNFNIVLVFVPGVLSFCLFLFSNTEWRHTDTMGIFLQNQIVFRQHEEPNIRQRRMQKGGWLPFSLI